MTDWLDLQPELLLKVATSCSGIQNGMRGACQGWKESLEKATTTLAIRGTGLPLNLAPRFIVLLELDLQGCDPAPTHQALRALLNLPSLTRLALQFSAAELNSDVLEVLLALRPRTSLVLSLSIGVHEITAPCTAGLRALGLARLHLQLEKGWDGWQRSLKDVHLGRLVDLPISQLDLSRSSITNSGIGFLREMSLASLDISDCSRIADRGLAFLRGWPLTRLNLGGLTRVTDAGLSILQGLPLTDLGLSNRLSNRTLEFCKDCR